MSFERIEGNWMHRCKAGEDRPGHASECPNCAPQAVPSSPAAMGRDPRIKQFWADVKECPDCKGPNGDYCGDHFERAKKLAAMVEAPAPPSGETGDVFSMMAHFQAEQVGAIPAKKVDGSGEAPPPPASRQEIREALEPFAKFAEAIPKFGRPFPQTGAMFTLFPSDGPVVLTVEDFKRAKEALNALRGEASVSGANRPDPLCENCGWRKSECRCVPESRPPALGSRELEEAEAALRLGIAAPFPEAVPHFLKAFDALSRLGTTSSGETSSTTHTKGESMKSEFHCCTIGCPKPAEWVIYPQNGKPYDDTHACTEHVGGMLSDAYEHRIFPIQVAIEQSEQYRASPSAPGGEGL